MSANVNPRLSNEQIADAFNTGSGISISMLVAMIMFPLLIFISATALLAMRQKFRDVRSKEDKASLWIEVFYIALGTFLMLIFFAALAL